MSEELSSSSRMHTWNLVPLPPDIPPVTCKWVYKIKTHSDGSIARYKAHLVAQGISKKYGLDYEETFALVAKMTYVRTLIFVATIHMWPLFQLEVKNAFLHGHLSEHMNMEPPPGISHPPNHVCLLRRALYGLKQAPRAWFERFTSIMLSAGFVHSEHDSAMFVKASTHSHVIVFLYVDDMIITGDDSRLIQQTKDLFNPILT